MTPPPAVPPDPLPARLGLWDAVSIIVGIVIGSSIFKVSGTVAAGVANPAQMFGVWLAGGGLSLLGALCYAELASTYPRMGGDYVYLTRAFGRLAGFLFGWAHLAGILTGSLGVLAYVFADYAVHLWKLPAATGPLVAVAAVAVLSLLNILGVVFGKTAQNILTTAKVAGLVAIAVCGFLAAAGAPSDPDALSVQVTGAAGGFGLAMILVLYAFGGWSDAAFVAAEVREPRRNIPRALILGVSLITLVYLAVNAAYLRALGWDGLRNSELPPADTLHAVLGPAADKAMSAAVMVSALGAISGLILTGSRVHASLGRDHRVFALLGRWHPRLETPVWSLVAQALVTVVLIVAVGTPVGQHTLDAALGRVGLEPIDWDRYGGGFDTLVAATAPIFWSFFLLTGLALFKLRETDRDIQRPFPVPLYPFVPFAFCLTSAWMLHASLVWAGRLSLLMLAPLALGIPLYLLSRRLPHKPPRGP